MNVKLPYKITSNSGLQRMLGKQFHYNLDNAVLPTVNLLYTLRFIREKHEQKIHPL